MKKLWIKIKAFFANPAKVVADAKKIVSAIRIIRNVLGTPAANNLVNIIPGQVDDRILAAVKTGLDEVLKYADALHDIADVLPSSNELTRNAILHKSASTALRQLHPQIDEATADLTIQKIYHRYR